MRTRSVRPKPMPRVSAKDGPWWPLLAWLVFSAVLVAIGVFLTPNVGIVYGNEGLPGSNILPGNPAVSQLADAEDAAVPMASTVLLPHEPAGTQIAWAPKL